jgi:hypothetical protein
VHDGKESRGNKAGMAGVNFSGQKFYEAQIQNCPARKTCGDSGEVKISYPQFNYGR